MNFKILIQLKNPSNEDRFSSVDPTGLAPVSLLVKGRILLHKLQARIHRLNFIRFLIKTKTPEIGGLCLTSSESAIYANSTFWFYYIIPPNCVNNKLLTYGFKRIDN